MMAAPKVKTANLRTAKSVFHFADCFQQVFLGRQVLREG